MREYESVFVLNPSVDETQVDAELEKIKEFLASKDSEITEVQKWGRRKLAYEIGKNREGVYTLIRFNAEASVPTELDRRYRLNENMLRYLTVLYERPAVEEGAEDASEEGARAEGKDSAPAPPAAAPRAGDAAPAAEAKKEEPKEEPKKPKEEPKKPKEEPKKEEPAEAASPEPEKAPESTEG